MTAFMGFPQDDYNFSSAEVAAALAGLVVRDIAGIPRTGVLRVGKLVSGVSGAWQLRVEAFPFVSSTGARVHISGIDEAEFIDVDPAPASGSRIDIVCWVAASASLTVVPGTPGASPSPPPTPGGMELLAEWRTSAGQVNAAQGVVVEKFRHAAVMGQALTVRTKAELDSFHATDGVKARCLADGYVYERLSGAWVGGEYLLNVLPPFLNPLPTAPLKLIVSDGIVLLVGETTTTKPGDMGDSSGPIAVIPAAFRPPVSLFTVQQGGGKNRWYLAIHPTGELNAGRFGPGVAGPNVWLPITTSWPLQRKG